MLWCQNLLYVGCLDDEPAEDDTIAEIEECGLWITKDSHRLARNFVQLEATCSQGQHWSI